MDELEEQTEPLLFWLTHHIAVAELMKGVRKQPLRIVCV
jgi:hypothetical protein